jgi:hypothetical protein
MPGSELQLVHAAGELTRRRGRATLPALLLLGACYTYHPLPGPLPMTGARVQVTLTRAGGDSLAARLGRDVGLVSGDVVRADSAALTLAVREVEHQNGEREDWLGEPVALPRRFVHDIEQRRMSLGGTGLLGGAIAAGLVVATTAIAGSGSVEGGNGGGGGTDR